MLNKFNVVESSPNHLTLSGVSGDERRVGFVYMGVGTSHIVSRMGQLLLTKCAEMIKLQDLSVGGLELLQVVKREQLGYLRRIWAHEISSFVRNRKLG